MLPQKSDKAGHGRALLVPVFCFAAAINIWSHRKFAASFGAFDACEVVVPAWNFGAMHTIEASITMRSFAKYLVALQYVKQRF